MPVEIGHFKSNLESAQIRTNPRAEMTCKHATRPRQSLFLSRPRCQLLDAQMLVEKKKPKSNTVDHKMGACVPRRKAPRRAIPLCACSASSSLVYDRL